MKAPAAIKDQWTPHATRNQVVDFVKGWSAKTELPTARLVRWVGIARGKYYAWQLRYGKVNEHTLQGTNTEQRRGTRSRRRLNSYNPPRGTRWVHMLVHNSKVTFVRFRLNQDKRV